MPEIGRARLGATLILGHLQPPRSRPRQSATERRTTTASLHHQPSTWWYSWPRYPRQFFLAGSTGITVRIIRIRLLVRSAIAVRCWAIAAVKLWRRLVPQWSHWTNALDSIERSSHDQPSRRTIFYLCPANITTASAISAFFNRSISLYSNSSSSTSYNFWLNARRSS